MKKTISLGLTLLMILSLLVGGLSVEAANYNSTAAVAYANNHWNDGKGLCAEFVSDCLNAGGITIPNKACYNNNDYSYNKNSGTLDGFTNPYKCASSLLLYLSKSYTVITDPKYSDIAIGDVVFMYGAGNRWRDGHVGIVVKINNGAPIYAAHNNATCTGSFSSSRYPTYVVKMKGNTVTTAPKSPTGLKAVAKASTTVTISWNSVSGAASYEVQYKTPNSGGWKADPDYKTKTATSYISTGLTNDYTYQYRVRAVNSAGTSAWVTIPYEKPVAPIKPTGLKAVANASTTVRISWKAVSGAASYEVQYQTPNSGGWKADPDYKTKTATSYISTGLIENYKYQYRVRAVNSAGTSAWVEISYKKPVVLPPTAPTGLKAVAKASTTVTVSWNAVSGADSYEVQYQTPNSSGWKADPDYKTKTATSYISTGLIENYKYQYRVRAVNSAGTSAWVEISYKKLLILPL